MRFVQNGKEDSGEMRFLRTVPIPLQEIILESINRSITKNSMLFFRKKQWASIERSPISDFWLQYLAKISLIR